MFSINKNQKEKGIIMKKVFKSLYALAIALCVISVAKISVCASEHLPEGATFYSEKYKYVVTKACTIEPETASGDFGQVLIAGFNPTFYKKAKKIAMSSSSFLVGTDKAGITLDVTCDRTREQFHITGFTSGAFKNCKKIVSVDVPAFSTDRISYGSKDKYLLDIPDNCFAGCTGLTKVTLGTNLTSSSETRIGKNAFKGCKKLIQIDLNTTPVFIGKNCFKNCKKLHTIVWNNISNTLPPVDVQANAFKNVKKVTIQSTLSDASKDLAIKMKRRGAKKVYYYYDHIKKKA